MMNGGAQAGMTQGAVPAIPPAGQEAPEGWTCACGQKNQGKFCSNCGKPAPKPSGPVAVDRLTAEISAPTAESRERKNRGQIPDTSCKIDVLMVESFK